MTDEEYRAHIVEGLTDYGIVIESLPKPNLVEALCQIKTDLEHIRNNSSGDPKDDYFMVASETLKTINLPIDIHANFMVLADEFYSDIRLSLEGRGKLDA